MDGSLPWRRSSFLILPFEGLNYDSSDKVVIVWHHFGDLPGRPLVAWETLFLDDDKISNLGIGLFLDPFWAICAYVVYVRLPILPELIG